MLFRSVFDYTPFFGNGISEKLFDQGLCLPSGSNMTEKDIQRIKELLDRVFIKDLTLNGRTLKPERNTLNFEP